MMGKWYVKMENNPTKRQRQPVLHIVDRPWRNELRSTASLKGYSVMEKR